MLERLREALGSREEVLLAVVYGSFLGGRAFRDVDVAVYVRGGVDPLDCKLEMERELSERVGYTVDVKVLNEAPAWFTLEVLGSGETLVERVPALAVKLYKKALDEAGRFSRQPGLP